MNNIGDIKFDDRYHIYKIWNGKKWRSTPSVSKIKGQLDKPALVHWAAKITAEYCINEIMPLVASGKLKLAEEDYKQLFQKAKGYADEKSSEACSIGTEVHNAVLEYVIRGTAPVGLSEAAQKSFNAYLYFEKSNNLGQVVDTERPLYSREYDFCGTVDIIRYKDNQLHIIDYKTSKDFYNVDMALQLAAYKILVDEAIKRGEFEDLSSEKIERVGIIRLDKKTGIPQFKDYTPWLKISTQMFLLLRDFLSLKEDFDEIDGLGI